MRSVTTWIRNSPVWGIRDKIRNLHLTNQWPLNPPSPYAQIRRRLCTPVDSSVGQIKNMVYAQSKTMDRREKEI